MKNLWRVAIFSILLGLLASTVYIAVDPRFSSEARRSATTFAYIFGSVIVVVFGIGGLVKVPGWIRGKVWHAQRSGGTLVEKALKVLPSLQQGFNYRVCSYSYFDYGTCMWDMGGPTHVVEVEKKGRFGCWQLILKATSSSAPMTSALYKSSMHVVVDSREEKALDEFLSERLAPVPS